MYFTTHNIFLGLVIGTATLLVYIVIRFLQTRRPDGFPPGLPTILGLGNLHQVPTQKAFLKFHEFHETYGDVVG